MGDAGDVAVNHWELLWHSSKPNGMKLKCGISSVADIDSLFGRSSAWLVQACLAVICCHEITSSKAQGSGVGGPISLPGAALCRLSRGYQKGSYF